MTAPRDLTSPQRHDGPLPEAVDVAIIGGGVVGVMTALYLARAGKSVVLLEKGRIAAEQSSRNWGWIRQQGRDPAELPIMIESLRLWQGLARELGPELGFAQRGVLYLAQTDADLERHEAWQKIGAAHGLDTRLLARCEVQTMLGPSAPWKGGMFTSSDARAEPAVAVPMLADLAVGAGVTIRESCAVRHLDLQAGRVVGVVTERGRIRAEQVVLAAGAWSRLFLGAHGLDIPQLCVKSSVAATEPMPAFFDGNAADSRFAFRRRADGGYTVAPGSAHDFYLGPNAFSSFFKYLTVLRQDFRSTKFHLSAPQGWPDAWSTPRDWADHSPFEDCRVLDPDPNPDFLADVTQAFATAFPDLGRPRLRATWAGMIDTMPDVVPIIDHAPRQGLIIATGMSGHGFGIGPGIGRVVADLVMGRDPGHDLHRFRFNRFQRGQKVILGPSL